MSSDLPIVNAWTQFGRLRTVVVGTADPKSCHLPLEPACQSEINDPHLAENIPWPGGQVKHPRSISRAEAQLSNFAAILEAETVTVKSHQAFNEEAKLDTKRRRTEVSQSRTLSGQDARIHHKGRIATMRTKVMDWSQPVAGPEWQSKSQYCGTCPRDTMITLGNTLLEATMSKRSRYFEHLSCRDICLDLWRQDPLRVKFWSAPKPSMADSMYRPEFWKLTEEERFQTMRNYQFCVNEREPVFDAADITRVGKDIFVQKSMTTNDAGIMWLRSHFPDLRVHALHFPYDLYPSHIDCTFVPLRPPAKDRQDGLALINPERPPLKKEMELWRQNGWKLLNAPWPARLDRPAFSQSSYWLSMNLLSLSESSVVIEEEELPLYNMLDDLGFDVITVPMRHMYEFGGAIHCCTWDIQREDECKDYFPDQTGAQEHVQFPHFQDVDVIDVRQSDRGFVLNPVQGQRLVGTYEHSLHRKAKL